MKKVIVTGATGFIGRHTIPFLLQKGYEVHAVSSKSIGHKAFVSQGLFHHTADLMNSDAVTKLFANVKPTHLLHLAWYATPGKFWTAPENLDWVKASIHLLQCFTANNGARVVMAGTCAEYDWSADICDEKTTPLKPATLYGVCKHSLHQILESYANKIGLSYAWGRVFFLHGPHEYTERLVPYVITNLLKKSIAKCSHGMQIRDFMHVEDTADAFVTLLDSPLQGAINVASGKEVVLRDVLHTIATELSAKDLIQFGAFTQTQNDPPRIIADVKRLSHELNWRPKYSLESGLQHTINWWKQQVMNGD